MIGATRAILASCMLLGAALPSVAATPATPADDSAIQRFTAAQAIAAATRGEIHLVDVRPGGQRALGHIKGDLHVPIPSISERHGELPRDRTLVFYCSCAAEETALEAARVLLATGARAGVLVGGYNAWLDAGGVFEVNATWDEIFRPDLPPVKWGKVPRDTTACRYARDAETAYRGKASGRIGCWTTSGQRGTASLQQWIPARELAGRAVTLSAMVHNEEVQPGAFLWLAAATEEEKVVAMERGVPDSIRGSRDWRRVELKWTVPKSASRILIGFSLMSIGGLWVDEVRLTTADEKGKPRAITVANAGFEE